MSEKPETAEPQTQEPATAPAGESTATGAETAPPAKKPKPVKRPASAGSGAAGRAVAVVALLAALGALAGGYYLWQQLQATRAALATTESALGERQAELRRELQSAVDGQGQALSAELTQAMRRTDAHVNELAQGVERLRQTIGRDGDGWLTAEVRHLLRTANTRLQLAHDVGGAIAALETADLRLANLADPAYTPVREALARELRSLRDTGEADLAGIALKLGSLVETVEKLPLAGPYAAEAAAPAAPAEPEPRVVTGWRDFLGALWADIRGLVTIRRTGQESAPALLPPNERFFLRQNLRLKLETARVALLNRQGEVFHAALGEAAQWLRSYFAVEAPAVGEALATVDALAQVPVEPALPDISGSLRALERVERRLQRDAGTPSERAP